MPAAQVALNWVASQPGITSTIIGATKLAQLDSNPAASEFAIPAQFRNRLEQASALEPAHPYVFFVGQLQAMINGASVRGSWPAPVSGATVLADAGVKSSATEA